MPVSNATPNAATHNAGQKIWVSDNTIKGFNDVNICRTFLTLDGGNALYCNTSLSISEPFVNDTGDVVIAPSGRIGFTYAECFGGSDLGYNHRIRWGALEPFAACFRFND